MSRTSLRSRPARALTVAALTSTLAVTLTAGPLTASSTAAPTPAKLGTDLSTVALSQLQPLLASGELTSQALTNAYIARIGQLNSRGPSLNAVRMLNPAAIAEAIASDRRRKRGAALGSLEGVPILLKDNIDVRRMPTTAGNVALEYSYPADDAPVVKQLRKAGAVILGKTNLSEFANFMTNGTNPSGYSSLGGQVLNAYDASQTPSGSSSGSGVAMSVGMGAGTVGTETSGSILSPASASSVVGIKPTVGLVSRTGIIPISATQDTAGPMTRTVTDAAVMLGAMAGRDPEDPATAAAPKGRTDFTAALSETALQGKRIGYFAATEGTDAVYARSIATLKAQGAELVPVTIDTTGQPTSILDYEFKRDLNAYLSRLPDSAPMKSMADIIAFNEAHAGVALKFGQSQFLESQAFDVTPGSADTVKYEADKAAGLAWAQSRIDTALNRGTPDTADDLVSIVYAQSGSAGIGARATYPSIVVPSGYSSSTRRPAGLSFLGGAFSEATLIGLAYDFEQAADAWKPAAEINPSLFRCVPPRTAPVSCAP